MTRLLEHISTPGNAEWQRRREVRGSGLARAVPDADLWTSVLRETDGDEEFWTHVYVTACQWKRGALDPLLRLVADHATSDVIITDALLVGWFTRMTAGSTCVTRSTEERDELREQHSEWLPVTPTGLSRHAPRGPARGKACWR